MPQAALYDTGPFAPCPRRFNMAAHTLAAACRCPDKIALEVLHGPGQVAERWTFGEVAEAVARAAGGLRALGIGKGDRVLLRLGNSADLPVLFFAANAIGAVPVPVSAQLGEAETATIVDDLKPSLIICGPGIEAARTAGAAMIAASEIAALRGHDPVPFASTAPDDPAYMVYTSGTGGRPKGVVHAQRAAWARRMMWDGWYGLDVSDRVLHAGAFNWTYTLGAGLTDPWAKGATALIYTGPQDRSVWPRLAAAHDASIFAAAPGVYRQMLGAEADLARGFAGLRHGLSAGEALPRSVREAWTGATGKPVYEALGMSEISTYVSFGPGSPAVEGCAGRPQPGRRVAILPESGEMPVARGEEGMLAVSRRDPGLMLGYWKQPEETRAAFRGEWFLTGDRARMGEDDAIAYLGRADDLMNAGGYRVSPQEVEACLLRCPGIVDAGVTEVEMRPGVTVIAAFYVPETEPLDEAVLEAHCAGLLARYKCPRAFHALNALPRGSNGKLQRRKLRQPQGAA